MTFFRYSSLLICMLCTLASGYTMLAEGYLELNIQGVVAILWLHCGLFPAWFLVSESNSGIYAVSMTLGLLLSTSGELLTLFHYWQEVDTALLFALPVVILFSFYLFWGVLFFLMNSPSYFSRVVFNTSV